MIFNSGSVGLSFTVKVALAELLPETRSVTSLVTLAVLLKVPSVSVRATTVAVAEPAFVRVLALKVTTPLACDQEP